MGLAEAASSAWAVRANPHTDVESGSQRYLPRNLTTYQYAFPEHTNRTSGAMPMQNARQCNAPFQSEIGVRLVNKYARYSGMRNSGKRDTRRSVFMARF
jgi:hypothetical protein